MFYPGLVSVTFRKLAPADILALVQQAGFHGIEWGGDIHVPHGDVARAREVRQRTLEAGLTVAAYGSYYWLHKSEADGLKFESVLESAVALGAPTMRVWAGKLGSAQADAAHWSAVVTEARRIGDLAASAGITVSFEYHGNTLTDTDASAQRLLREIDHPNVYTLWQPRNGATPAEVVEGLRAILPRLTNVHAFHWWPDAGKRCPLSEGVERWREYLNVVRTTGRDHHVLLEFVPNDDPQQFLTDAVTLKELLASGN